jgi:hypothetical protein
VQRARQRKSERHVVDVLDMSSSMEKRSTAGGPQMQSNDPEWESPVENAAVCGNEPPEWIEHSPPSNSSEQGPPATMSSSTLAHESLR